MRLALTAIVAVVPMLAAALIYERQRGLANFEKPIVVEEPAPDAMQHLHRGPWVLHPDAPPLLRREPYRLP